MRLAAAVAKHFLILGRERQSFLGARWVTALLAICPRRLERPLALRLLGLSPHYFYRHVRPEYDRMPKKEFLEAEFERNRASRKLICDRILRPHLREEFSVLDLGCGPGFLAKHVSAHVRSVFAADISTGVLGCARIINSAENLSYIVSSEQGFRAIPDRSLDLAYSFAVIQHVTDEVFTELLKTVSAKLKPGGHALLHVVLDDEGWTSEREWADDESLRGKVKYRYGLHCFSREKDAVVRMASDVGLNTKEVVLAGEVAPDLDDDISSQHLVLLEKTGRALTDATPGTRRSTD